MKDDVNKHISILKYLPREPESVHAPYMPEMDFYAAVKMGNIKRVRELCEEPFHSKEGLGVLSDDALRNMKYHFVISAALIARMCIEGGMPLSEAYGTSDYYIRQADRLKDIDKISSLHDEMSLDYTARMRKLSSEKVYSKPVTDMIEYILEHLDTRIKMEDLCALTGLSSSYLSRIFKEETGVTITAYILQKKLETARNMLDYSSHPVTWISNTLAFPSQSYFCKVFKEAYGISPANYRRDNAHGALTSRTAW